MAREIILNQEEQIFIVTREEVTINTDKISIDMVSDDGTKVFVKISFFNTNGYTKNLILWEGDSYTQIGQWTDQDVDNRIKELLNLT
jgi:hypothetical protein